jgi:hypothetical protein
MIIPIIVFVVVLGGALAFIGYKQGWFTKAAPVQPVGSVISLAPNYWTIGPIINGTSDSPNMPMNPTAEGAGWLFSFPIGVDGVHYVTTGWTGSLVGKTITMTFSISGGPDFVGLNSGQPDPNGVPSVRLYFQQAGDNWDTDGFRWWSINPNSVALAPGSFTISVPVSPDLWSGIFGEKGTDKPALWNAAVANVANVGFTFGSEFFGHGVYAKEPAQFHLTGFTIQ